MNLSTLLSGCGIALMTQPLFAQLSPPRVENVYGGRILAITGYSKASDTSRVFISTESANSVFYADVYTPSTGSAVVGNFGKMPAADADDNFGPSVSKMAVHAASGRLFFVANGRLYSAEPSASEADSVGQVFPQSLMIIDSFLFFIQGSQFHFGTLDASGSYTEAGVPVNIASFINNPFITYSPLNNKVYIMTEGNAPKIYKSSDAYSAISSSTSFSDLSPATLSSTVQWRAFGIAPSGRLFVGGSDASSKSIAYTDDELTWNEYNTGIAGVAGSNMDFSGDSASYYVYFSSAYNNNNGMAGSWQNFGIPGGFETHPNDGDVFADPNKNGLVYITTDQGIGASADYGSTIFEIDDGVEAVQVNDFDMTSDKNTAWLASKAGIRKVSTYQGSPSWTAAIFPNSDGSPYYSAAMLPGDTNTVYVGNVRVYQTINGGAVWNMVFTPETAPYNFSSVGTVCEAIEVCPYKSTIIMAGYSVQNTSLGGLFVSADGGSAWNQLLLDASVTGPDADVLDIIFNKEGSDTVAYVGVESSGVPGAPRSIYRLVKSGASWVVTQDMDASGTSTGTPITATISDLQLSASGDTVLACGTDVGANHPIAYYKPISSGNKWTPFTTSGFPFAPGKMARAITIGVDTVYCAVDNEIYYMVSGAASWALGYSYPVGTQIYVLYYDDLLAGTGTGLYGHSGAKPTGIPSHTKQGAIMQLLPNPSDGRATLTIKLDEPAKVNIVMYDMLGRKKEILAEQPMQKGLHELNLLHFNVAEGMYLIRLKAENKSETIKMIIR